MALLTDDPDFGEDYMRTTLGGNGDYYIQVVNRDKEGMLSSHSVRIAMSGGNAPTRVKLAIAELHRAMEEAGLNEWPED